MVSLGGRTGVSAAFIVVVLAAAFLGPSSALPDGRDRRARGLGAGHDPSATVHVRGQPAGGDAARARRRRGGGVLAAERAVGDDRLLPGGRPGGRGRHRAQLRDRRLLQPRAPPRERARASSTLKALAPSLALSVVLAVAGAAIYLELGIAGIAFALTAVFAFSYMAAAGRAVARARRAVRLALLGRARRPDALARHPRWARRAPRRGGGAVLAGHRHGGRDEPPRSASSPTPPGCCMTSATSRSRTAWPSGAGR